MGIPWGFAVHQRQRSGRTFSIYAPQTAVVLWNDIEILFEREGDYVRLGGMPFPPRAVNNLALSDDVGHVTLRWSPVREDILGQPVTVTGYNVYRQVGHTDPPELVATVAGTDTLCQLPYSTEEDTLHAIFYVVKAFYTPLPEPRIR